MGCPISLGLVFCILQRWLRPRGAYAPKKLTHFTSKCFAHKLVLRPNEKKGVPHFTLLVFCTFRAGSVHAVLMHKKKGLPISPQMCFAEQCPCSNYGVIYSTPPISIAIQSSQPIIGGSSPDRSESPSCNFGSLRGGFNLGSLPCTTSERMFSRQIATQD